VAVFFSDLRSPGKRGRGSAALRITEKKIGTFSSQICEAQGRVEEEALRFALLRRRQDTPAGQHCFSWTCSDGAGTAPFQVGIPKYHSPRAALMSGSESSAERDDAPQSQEQEPAADGEESAQPKASSPSFFELVGPQPFQALFATALVTISAVGSFSTIRQIDTSFHRPNRFGLNRISSFWRALPK
jgi:hypothetical protein